MGPVSITHQWKFTVPKSAVYFSFMSYLMRRILKQTLALKFFPLPLFSRSGFRALLGNVLSIHLFHSASLFATEWSWE